MKRMIWMGVSAMVIACVAGCNDQKQDGSTEGIAQPEKVDAKVVAPAAVVSNTVEIPAKSAVKTSTPAGWLDDFEEAKALAGRNGKKLLVDFSGSDWCGWCQRLDQEVFSQKEFLEGVSKDYVLVFIDSPRDKSLLSETAKKQNPELAKTYKVRGFPTVFIMTAEGEVVAQTGYQAGGAVKYLEHLKALSASCQLVQTMISEVKTMPVGSKARVARLHETLSTADLKTQQDNKAYIQEILAADPDGSLGMRAKYGYFVTIEPLEQKIHALMNEMNTMGEAAMRELRASGAPEDTDINKVITVKVLSKVITRWDALVQEIAAAKDAATEDTRETLTEMHAQMNNFVQRIKEELQSVQNEETK